MEIPPNNDQSDAPAFEPDDGIRDNEIVFDNKAFKSVSNTMRALKAMQDALSDPTTIAIKGAIGSIMQDTIVQRLGGGAPAKTGFLSDLFNSQFGANLGQTLGQQLPSVIESLGKVLGKDKAQELATSATQYMNQQQEKQKQLEQQEQQNDLILQLDVNNPDHVKAYASEFKYTEDAAKSIIPIHKNSILEKRKIQPPQQSASTQPIVQDLEKTIAEQNQIMQKMYEKIAVMDEHIKKLEAEKLPPINDSNDKWQDDDKAPGFVGSTIQPKNVTLFNQPVKVDVDDIKGDTNSFFKDPPKDEKKIEITTIPVKEELKQIIDAEGNSKIVIDEPVAAEPEVKETIVEEPKVEEVKPEKKIHRVIKKKDEIKSEEIK